MKLKNVIFLSLFLLSSLSFAQDSSKSAAAIYENFMNKIDEKNELVSVKLNSFKFIDKDSDGFLDKFSMNYEINYNYLVYQKALLNLENEFDKIGLNSKKIEMKDNELNSKNLLDSLNELDFQGSAFVTIFQDDNGYSVKIWQSDKKFSKRLIDEETALSHYGLYYTIMSQKRTLVSNTVCFNQNISFISSYLSFDKKDFIIIHPYFASKGLNEACKINKVKLSENGRVLNGVIMASTKVKVPKNIDYKASLILKRIKQADLKMFSNFTF